MKGGVTLKDFIGVTVMWSTGVEAAYHSPGIHIDTYQG